jgi:hypothetical protein
VVHVALTPYDVVTLRLQKGRVEAPFINNTVQSNIIMIGPLSYVGGKRTLAKRVIETHLGESKSFNRLEEEESSAGTKFLNHPSGSRCAFAHSGNIVTTQNDDQVSKQTFNFALKE